ncbi:Citrate synthase [Dirofilaria immitis]
MVASFFTVNNQTFSDYRSPAIHIVLSSKLLMFFNTSHIESPFDDKRQLQDFLANVNRNFPQLILKNTVDNNLILQREWKILISTKSVMVYGFSLFNTFLIILFIAICTMLFVGSIFRFSWLQQNTVIRTKKSKRLYQCQIDEIKILRMLQVERNGQILRQKYKEIAKNLYTFFGVPRENQICQLFRADFALSNDIFMMNLAEMDRWRKENKRANNIRLHELI